jgi:hypothetical protein
MEHMKQEKLLLIIGIVLFTFSQGVFARADTGNKAAADATLTAYELGAVPEDQPLGSLPRWRSSLGEIQQASKVLLETNFKLTQEARQLKKDLDGLQKQIEQQRVRNVQLSDEITQGRGKAQNDDAVETLRLKEALSDRKQQIQSQKDMLASLKARRGSMETRVSLAQLRLDKAELDEKTKSVDGKLQDGVTLNAMRVQNEKLRDKIVEGERQVVLLGEKTEELKGVDNPYIASMRDDFMKNAELRERLADLREKTRQQQSAFERVAVMKLAAEKDLSVLRVQKLLNDRELLQLRLKENSDKLFVLKNDLLGQAVVVPGISSADIDKVEKQNAAMESLMGDLRENVALLEYKVTTLQRYKDRNKPVFQK